MARSAPLVLALALGSVACSGGATVPDAMPASDADTSLCAGRACLAEIRTAADWDRVTMPYTGARCDFLEDGKYLAPATAAAALPVAVFQDVNTHRLHLDFMTQVFPEYFGGLTPQTYQAIVQRRATRQYWAGSLYRLVDEAGATTGYGFDVITDPSAWDEELTEAEVTAVGELLAARFHLPLVYTPTTDGAIYAARGFATLPAHFGRACQHVTCATPGVDCVEVPAPITLCGEFLEGRSIEMEYAHKSTLTAGPGTVELPRDLGTHVVPAIFTGGAYGPSALPIVPVGTTATYEVTDIGAYRYHRYRQAMTAGAHAIEVIWELSLPEAGGGFLLAEAYAEYAYVNGEIDGSVEYDDRVDWAACGDVYDPWRVTGALAGGDGFTIDFRYELPSAGSGPLHPRRAEVTLGGQTTTVTDYFDLVYAGEHHNWNNQYWVVFDAPLTYAGHPVHGLWVDEQPYSFMVEAVHTLDASHAPVDLLTVDSYAVGPIAP